MLGNRWANGLFVILFLLSFAARAENCNCKANQEWDQEETVNGVVLECHYSKPCEQRGGHACVKQKHQVIGTQVVQDPDGENNGKTIVVTLYGTLTGLYGEPTRSCSPKEAKQ